MSHIVQDHVKEVPQALKTLKKNFITSHRTKNVNYRLVQLKKLHDGMTKMRAQLQEAVAKDLGCRSYGADLFHIQPCFLEVEHIIANFRQWAAAKSVNLNMISGPGWGKIRPEPLGVALVMSSWNYPFATGLPYVAMCIATGNCCIYKPSERAPECSRIQKILIETFLD